MTQIDAPTITTDDGEIHSTKEAVGSRGPLVFGILILVLVTLLLGQGTFEGNLADTDAYTWANRVTDLRADGDWFDDASPRVNPPAGHATHWSRPFDVVLMSGAMLLEPMLGFDDALFAWAAAVPVLLGASTLAIMWWGFSAYLREWGRFALAIFFVVNPALAIYFLFGRSDHQSLIAVCVAALLAQSARLLDTERSSLRDAISLGAIAGLALWVSVETVIAIGAVFAALCMTWAVTERPACCRIWQATLSWAVFSAGGLLAENGFSGWNHRRFDELSIIAVVLACTLSLGLYAIDRLHRRGALVRPPARSGSLALCASGAAVLLFVLFPDLQQGAEGDVDPLYRATRLAFLSEGVHIFGDGVAVSIARFSTYFVALPLALVGAILTVKRRASVTHLLPFAPTALAAVAYSVATLDAVRWGGTAAIPLTVLAAATVQTLVQRLPRPWPIILITAAALWWVPALVISASAGTTTSTTIADWCDTKPVADALGDPNGLGSEPAMVLASADLGPELIYRTPHSVFSIPNHRFQPGYTAAYDIMTEDRLSEAQTLFERSGADYILVCTRFPAEWVSRDQDALVNRLATGRVPTWLIEVPMQTDSGAFKLFTASDR